ncbi:hypothetical protein BDFG_02274 [Blastomyces dermatitidis ATCC 26199]|nr:hypothetical protein BDFG_02274 [Blastomyces dermatitidis ATCC 26199]
MNPHQLLRSREVGAGQHQQTSHYHIHQSGSAAEFGISIRDTIRLIERLATSPRFSGPTASNLQEKAFRFLPASPVQY